ncbi:adenosine deaminase [Nitratireductor aquibiodomus]|uniref:Adenine deaminase n=1 Tax=Nitratireductor aquibiodomus TaxID=204799 RepID=A0A1H4JVA4_9HYPH|nr:adenosine deaminase [Nitratireductor aquibiodomus]SEB49582.1 adenosine deaminase [Nitratireductor aquibiodomus]
MNADIFKEIPKTELHVHLEGCLEPEQVIRFSARNNVKLEQETLERLRTEYTFDGLNDFVSVMGRNSATIQTEEDIYEIAFGYLKRAAEDNIVHAEMAFSPQGPAQRGVPYEAAFNGIISAFKDAYRDFGITGGPILACLRHRPVGEALAMLKKYARTYRDDVLAIGLHGAELGYPPGLFEECFAYARTMGWKAVAHAGEEGPADYIWQAIDILQVDRIDHGVQCEVDDRLVERLAETATPLTVCPLSNIHLKVFRELAEHNFLRLLDRGLNVSIHTDDPAYFNGYLSEHYRILHEAGVLDEATLALVQRNAFRSAFMDRERSSQLINASDQMSE